MARGEAVEEREKEIMSQSKGLQLLSLIWENAQTATGHSWLKLNHALGETLSLAIRAGFKFDLGDWKAMERFRPGYWRYIENNYRDAVVYRNASAYQAIEEHLGRKPFIVKGASIDLHTGDGPCGEGLARLIIGAQFDWDGRRVKVTSIENAHVVACAYPPWTHADSDPCPTCDRSRKYQSSSDYKPLKRYKITHADIAAAKKAAKTSDK